MDRDNKLIFEALQQKPVAGPQTYIYLDLYTGKTSVLPKGDFEEATRGLEVVKGKITVYRGEEYMVLAIPTATAVSKQ